MVIGYFTLTDTARTAGMIGSDGQLARCAISARTDRGLQRKARAIADGRAWTVDVYSADRPYADRPLRTLQGR